MLRCRPSEITLTAADVDEARRRIVSGQYPGQGAPRSRRAFRPPQGMPRIRRGPDHSRDEAVTRLGVIPILRPHSAVPSSIDSENEDGIPSKPLSTERHVLTGGGQFPIASETEEQHVRPLPAHSVHDVVSASDAGRPTRHRNESTDPRNAETGSSPPSHQFGFSGFGGSRENFLDDKAEEALTDGAVDLPLHEDESPTLYLQGYFDAGTYTFAELFTPPQNAPNRRHTTSIRTRPTAQLRIQAPLGPDEEAYTTLNRHMDSELRVRPMSVREMQETNQRTSSSSQPFSIYELPSSRQSSSNHSQVATSLRRAQYDGLSVSRTYNRGAYYSVRPSQSQPRAHPARTSSYSSPNLAAPLSAQRGLSQNPTDPYTRAIGTQDSPRPSAGLYTAHQLSALAAAQRDLDSPLDVLQRRATSQWSRYPSGASYYTAPSQPGYLPQPTALLSFDGDRYPDFSAMQQNRHIQAHSSSPPEVQRTPMAGFASRSRHPLLGTSASQTRSSPAESRLDSSYSPSPSSVSQLPQYHASRGSRLPIRAPPPTPITRSHMAPPSEDLAELTPQRTLFAVHADPLNDGLHHHNTVQPRLHRGPRMRRLAAHISNQENDPEAEEALVRQEIRRQEERREQMNGGDTGADGDVILETPPPLGRFERSAGL